MNVADSAAVVPEVATADPVAVSNVATTSSHEFVALPNLLIKDEPQDDPEITESALTLNDDDDDCDGNTTISDPMNLLEPAEERDFYEVRSEVAGSVDENAGAEEEEKDSDVAGEECVQNESQTTVAESTTSARNEEKWQPWLIQQQAWLFCDEVDPDWSYCLYCDVRVSVKNKNYNNARQHGESVVHKERADNYIAFQTNAEKATEGCPPVDIKQEFGTSSNIEAIKLKRISQAEPLNNFNWRRWLQAHDWLVRDRPDGVIGYCQCCCFRLNVEFSYKRERHEQGKKHKDAARVFQYNQEKKAAAANGAEPMETNEEEAAEEEEEGEEEQQVADADADDNEDEQAVGELIVPNTVRNKFRSNPWYEPLPKSTFCRCRLCDCKIGIPSFRKHIKSKLHLENLRYHVAKNKSVKQEFQSSKRNWKILQKEHPWLVADPKDAQFAYCKICERRQMYGNSLIKRVQHENSAGHREAIKQKQASGESEQQDADAEVDEEEAEQTNEASEADEESEAEEENDDDDEEEVVSEKDENDNDDAEEDTASESKKKRFKRGTDAWFEMFPWCDRVGKNTHNFRCTYCDSVLAVETRVKHAKGFRHIQNEKMFLRKKDKTAKKPVGSGVNLYERSLKDKRVHYYPWLVYAKNNPKIVFCKYCRVRYSSSLSRVQHQSSKRHVEAAKQYLTNNKNEKERHAPSPSSKSASPSPVPYVADDEPEDSKPKPKALSPPPPQTMHGKVLLWKNRFPWLSYKRNELRPNYGYCKYCDQRIFVPTLKFAAKHQRSSKHIRTRLLLKRKREENEAEERAETDPQTDAEENVKTTSDNKNENTSSITAVTSVTNEEERQMAAAWQALQKKYAWLLPDQNDHKDYGYCKWCEVRMPLKAMNLTQHQNTNGHCDNVEKLRQQRSAVNKISETDRDGDMIMQSNPYDDNEEEDEDDADDITSTKSDSMDDGGLGVLQLLLERTMNTKQRQQHQQLTNCGADANAANELPPAKRARTMHDSTTAAIDTARQLTAAHGELLRMTRQFSAGDGGNGSDKKRARNSLPANLLTSSFSIAACLSPLMQQLAAPPPPHQSAATALPPPTQAQAATPATPTATPPNTFDLFFNSVSETVKKLPSDLAAEARMKVMQIIYDLELRALRRNQASESDNTIEITAAPSGRAAKVVADGDDSANSNSSPQSPLAATASLANGFENGEHNNSGGMLSNKTIGLSSENSFHLIPISVTPPRANTSATNVSPPQPNSDSFLTSVPITSVAASTFTNSALSSTVDTTLRRIQLNSAVQITSRTIGGNETTTNSCSPSTTTAAATSSSSTSIRCIPINALTQSGTRVPSGPRTAQQTTMSTPMPRPTTKFISIGPANVTRGVNLQGQQIVVTSASPSNNTTNASSSSVTAASTSKQFATMLQGPLRQFRA